MKENGVNSSPGSLVYIEARESYPKRHYAFDDPSLSIPFPELSGENVEFLGKCSEAVFAISNFRFFAAFPHAFINIPLMVIENLEWKGKEFPEIFVYCKNGQSFQLKFASAEECGIWYERLKQKCGNCSTRLEDLFAFAFYAWNQDPSPDGPESLDCFSHNGTLHYDFLSEYQRMGFDKDDAWKITDINSKFELCASYPKLHIVPNHITDEKLENIAKFRTSRRFPSAVWRHSENGAVIVRCSQPEVGFLYWRCEDDELYLQTLGNVMDPAKEVESDGGEMNETNADNVSSKNGFGAEGNLNQNAKCESVDKKVLVIDCRSYSVAFANRVKGGGSECTEYYPNCKIQFMGLANIHTIRKSFQSLRELCGKQDEQSGWLASLEATKWLSHISSLIKTSLVIVKAVEQEKQHVVIHCSDGWDRTAQVVSLAQLLLDPFYRTIKGFRVLLEREWLAFGHKFADRCGHSCQEDDINERCPVFLQWLDCVHQLLRQFPCSFEFNENFLVKLVHHTYSCVFGTFLCNNEQERLAANIRNRTCSVWPMLDSQSRNCKNFLYSPHEHKVLYPEYQVRNILLWSSLYLSTSLTIFDTTSSNSSDTSLGTEHEFHHQYSRVGPEARPCIVRRNSDGDVKISSTDENFVASSGARDDCDLYLTKSHSSKSCTEAVISPFKSLTVKKKSNEDSCENEAFSQHEVNSCDNNSMDQNGENSCESISVDRNGESNGCENNSDQIRVPLEDSNGCEITAIDQNVTRANNCCENLDTDQNLEKSELDSMTSSCDTLVGEPSNINAKNMDCSEEKCSSSEYSLESLKTRTVSKAIDCRSNHRVSKSRSSDERSLRGATSAEEQTSEFGSYSIESINASLSPGDVSFNKIRKHLDIDGLAIVLDPVQARLGKLERCYRAQIDDLQAQLHACVCGPQPKYNVKKELFTSTEPAFDGPASLSSNATSDCGSWERVDDEGLHPVLWVPDHAAVSCGSCDVKFSITNRRHHCRNCGRVFCGSCCSESTPVPSELLYDPVRVCKTCFEMLHVPNGKEITVSAS